MSQVSATTQTLQNPNWKPIYSQEILFTQDQLKNYIGKPKDQNLKERRIARIGKLDSVEINYFNEPSKALKPLRDLFPFFY